MIRISFLEGRGYDGDSTVMMVTELDKPCFNSTQIQNCLSAYGNTDFTASLLGVIGAQNKTLRNRALYATVIIDIAAVVLAVSTSEYLNRFRSGFTKIRINVYGLES